MIIRKDFFKTDSVLPVLVLGFSVLNLCNQFCRHNILSAILSVVGLVGVFLFTLENKLYARLIYLWLVGQVLIITHEFLQPGTTNWDTSPVLDLSQGLNFMFSFSLTYPSDKYFIGINILPFIGFGLLKALQTSPVMGKSLTFYQFRENNQLGEFFPLTGQIIKRVILSGEKDWLFVELTHPFQFENSSVGQVIIKRKDGELLKLEDDYQLVWFRLVPDGTELSDSDNPKEKFPFIDWALCR